MTRKNAVRTLIQSIMGTNSAAPVKEGVPAKSTTATQPTIPAQLQPADVVVKEGVPAKSTTATQPTIPAQLQPADVVVKPAATPKLPEDLVTLTKENLPEFKALINMAYERGMFVKIVYTHKPSAKDPDPKPKERHVIPLTPLLTSYAGVPYFKAWCNHARMEKKHAYQDGDPYAWKMTAERIFTAEGLNMFEPCARLIPESYPYRYEIFSSYPQVRARNGFMCVMIEEEATGRKTPVFLRQEDADRAKEVKLTAMQHEKAALMAQVKELMARLERLAML